MILFGQLDFWVKHVELFVELLRFSFFSSSENNLKILDFKSKKRDKFFFEIITGFPWEDPGLKSRWILCVVAFYSLLPGDGQCGFVALDALRYFINYFKHISLLTSCFRFFSLDIEQKWYRIEWNHSMSFLVTKKIVYH